MVGSSDRILTSHVGSLPRPIDLLDLMKARLAGEPFDQNAYDDRVSRAVGEVVERQTDCGIDIVADGEQSKPGFFTYVRERLEGFEPRPGLKVPFYEAETQAFPEYYKEYFARAMGGGSVAPVVPMVCVGPVSYRGQEPLKKDIANLQAATKGKATVAAFMPSVAPSGAGHNQHYRTEEEYLYAVGEALRYEYQAIVDGGFQVQIDDPFLADIYCDIRLNADQRDKKARTFVEALNHALRGIPAEKIRFHTCYGINEGPRIYDTQLKDILGHMLRVNAAYYSFEGANARHEHEYRLWETTKLPDGKALVPGVITHASNIVEHPELIADRIIRYAKLVGRERVIASVDCGFSSQASYRTEVDRKVVWEKLKAMVEGARLASKQLWQ